MQYFATENGNRWHIERKINLGANESKILHMLCGLVFYLNQETPQSLVDVDSAIVCKNCKRWSEKTGGK